MVAIYYLPKITSLSLEAGIIPKYCPVCRGPVVTFWNRGIHSNLHIHHWGPGSKPQAIRNGDWRRICESCNLSLRVLGKEIYSSLMTWKEQLSTLGATSEEAWSKLLPAEEFFFHKVTQTLNLGYFTAGRYDKKLVKYLSGQKSVGVE